MHIYLTSLFPPAASERDKCLTLGASIWRPLAFLPVTLSPSGFNPWVGRKAWQLQYSCLENPHGQSSLVGYNPWGHKELDTTEVT